MPSFCGCCMREGDIQHDNTRESNVSTLRCAHISLNSICDKKVVTTHWEAHLGLELAIKQWYKLQIHDIVVCQTPIRKQLWTGNSARQNEDMLAASCLGLLGRSALSRSGRDKRELTVRSTMSTSETELIDSTYMVTPTSTGGPAIKPNCEYRSRLAS
ncbi:unnamed protein product [Pieris brassicae]|uniref:Uncharacterized protein n=1 Tax=Pieris brassicae TaxID=7116 RepID=A0A9P0TU51_PIEBR|nr:unnamed protein product [Pieris brassicae]